MQKRGILFVCLGNICRSPLAEGVFRDLVAKGGLQDSFRIESCGAGDWHVGKLAHKESIRVAKKNGIRLDGHRARQVHIGDFEEFDLLVAMDESNAADLKAMSASKYWDKIVLLRDYDPLGQSDLNVPDPYYGGPEGFEDVCEMISRCCKELLKELLGS